MNELNACAPSEPPYGRRVLKRMEQANDSLRLAVAKLTERMDVMWGAEPTLAQSDKDPNPPVACVIDEFDAYLNTQDSLLNKLNAEITRLSKFL